MLFLNRDQTILLSKAKRQYWLACLLFLHDRIQYWSSRLKQKQNTHTVVAPDRLLIVTTLFMNIRARKCIEVTRIVSV